MSSKIVVFLGPSLPRDEARKILPAKYLPPVAVGDVFALTAAERPDVIAIIDGVFERVPSVWHKEILHALASGIRVCGSSSMGALRAAELASFGMEGVGAVYQSFRDGTLEDDDEVAVIHGPAETGFAPMSEAMVNLRHGLSLAEARGILSAASAQRLAALAKRTFYPERTWEALFAGAPSVGVPSDEVAALRTMVRELRPNLKRRDAMELLEYLRSGEAKSVEQAQPFDFEPTIYWRKLVASIAKESS